MSPTEWSAALAQQLLTRYGVVTREVGAAESIPGGFSAVYDVLRALDESGRVRRGFFVGGVGATQFALPPALDLLRSLRQPPEEPEAVILGAADPANPYGTLLKWPSREADGTAPRRDDAGDTPVRRGPTRTVGARVVLVDGACVAHVSRGGRQILTWLPEAEPERSRAARALSATLATVARSGEGRDGGLLVSDIDAVPAHEHPLAPFLVAAGFVRSGLGYQVRRERRPDPGRADARAAAPSIPRRAMPEGDTIFRAARTLHRALAGHVVTRFDTAYAPLARVHDDTPITGRTVEAVEARGKHLVMRFSGDLVLRTHMRMHGSWHIYRPGERWQRPPREMRVLVGTADFVAVGFNVPDAEFEAARDVGARDAIARLGPGPARAGLRRGRGRAPPAGARRHDDRRGAARSARAGRHRQRVQVGGAVRRRRRAVRDGGDDRRGSPGGAGRHRAPPARRQRRRRGTRPRAPHHRPARAGRRPVGLRARRPAVPAVRHADFVREAGPRGAPDLLVPALPDGLNDSGVQSDSGVVGRRAVRETRRRIAYATSTPRSTSVRTSQVSPAID